MGVGGIAVDGAAAAVGWDIGGNAAAKFTDGLTKG